MGLETNIFSGIKNILKNDSTLKTYVNAVYEGLVKDDDTYVADNVTCYILVTPLSCSIDNPANTRTGVGKIGSGVKYCQTGGGGSISQQLHMKIGIVGGLIIGDEERQVLNNKGKGIANDYSTRTIRGAKVIIDRATGLMWQQSGSNYEMKYDEVKKWITELNQKRYAGYNNWRLPTLKEAMSLMEPKMNASGLNISPDFDNHQVELWTSDFQSAHAVWIVNFDLAGCHYYMTTQSAYVRAVR